MKSPVLMIIALIASSKVAYAASDVLPGCGNLGNIKECMCEIEKLRPTRVSVGLLHVKDILRKSPEELQMRASERPTQVVVGPDEELYVTDGHHHARAMLD